MHFTQGFTIANGVSLGGAGSYWLSGGVFDVTGSLSVLVRPRHLLLVALGESVGRAWFVAVDGVSGRTEPLERSVKEDILFLSGECAGLLFFRDLAQLGD